jgi:hypothetical protein
VQVIFRSKILIFRSQLRSLSSCVGRVLSIIIPFDSTWLKILSSRGQYWSRSVWSRRRNDRNIIWAYKAYSLGTVNCANENCSLFLLWSGSGQLLPNDDLETRCKRNSLYKEARLLLNFLLVLHEVAASYRKFNNACRQVCWMSSGLPVAGSKIHRLTSVVASIANRQ